MILAIIIIFIYMSVWFGLSIFLKRNDVADVAWGLGFVLTTLITFLQQTSISSRSLLVLILIGVWGIRLSTHIFKRNFNRPEDARYSKWRTEWKGFFLIRSYLQVFLLQGFLMFLILIPTILINSTKVNQPLGIFDLLGLFVWIIGFYFESVGDAELARFLSNPENKGKILDSGLWRYTRHPNYFGEVTMWWGIWIMSCSVISPLYTIIGPLTITFLILKVSGIPMLEKKMLENSMFDEYRRKTSTFIPWFPKK